MSTPAPFPPPAMVPPGRRGRWWRLPAFAAVLAAVVVQGTGTVSAAFRDSDPVTGNTLAAGTIDVSVAPASALLTMADMKLGDTVTAAVTVTNTGNMRLRYAITSTTTEAVLAAQLDLTIKTGVTSCTNGGFASTGTVLAPAGDLGATTGRNVLGDPAPGLHAGDRTMDSGTSEVLCFQVSLPITSSNAYQGLTTTAVFRFAAEQTVNNP